MKRIQEVTIPPTIVSGVLYMCCPFSPWRQCYNVLNANEWHSPPAGESDKLVHHRRLHPKSESLVKSRQPNEPSLQ